MDEETDPKSSLWLQGDRFVFGTFNQDSRKALEDYACASNGKKYNYLRIRFGGVDEKKIGKDVTKK